MGLKNVLQPKQEIDYVSFSFQGTRLMLTECDKSFFWLLFFIVIDFLIFFFFTWNVASVKTPSKHLLSFHPLAGASM